MTGRFADIIIDISNEQVDRLFTYRVPQGMDLRPGQRVEVPFGRRPREGFVIELKDQCELDENVVKPVSRTLEDYPVILPELIDLAQWMKKRMCPAFVRSISMRGTPADCSLFFR